MYFNIYIFKKRNYCLRGQGLKGLTGINLALDIPGQIYSCPGLMSPNLILVYLCNPVMD